MKISELIEELKSFKKEFGNINVMIVSDSCVDGIGRIEECHIEDDETEYVELQLLTQEETKRLDKEENDNSN